MTWKIILLVVSVLFLLFLIFFTKPKRKESDKMSIDYLRRSPKTYFKGV